MRRVLGWSGQGVGGGTLLLPLDCIGTCGDPDTSCMGAQGSAMQKGVS